MQTGAGPSDPERHGITTNPDGGSGYVLPTLIGRSGLQPATPACAAAQRGRQARFRPC